MKKLSINLFVILFILMSCSGKPSKKRSLDDTLYAYASSIRWSNFDAAVSFLKADDKTTKPRSFELQRLKQFKVSSYAESPIKPGPKENVILQSVEIQLYNIHNNKTRTIYDHQSWEYDAALSQWLLTSGLPKL
ncbi:hypothetical protein MNBD_GAMMA01-1017 [hydrothermal vent metagenome]|uniref:Lipoprotein n=1 Tax=hydrothermal vent metagenome TaxID=652676 RepID=A0A3B0W6Q0_9ZZZZ